MSTVVLLGATGYTGGLALASMLERGLRPVLSGSRAAALRELAARHGELPYQVADASDPASIRALLGAGDVLVTTVGPFDRLGRVVAEAAIEQGAHYVDSTGEVGFVRHLMDRHHTQAQETGSTVLSAFGFDYVPGILAASLAAREAGTGARSLDVGYFAAQPLGGSANLSHGTRRTVIEEMGRPTFVLRDGQVTTQRLASAVESFDVGGEPRKAVLAPGTEVFFLPRHAPALRDVRVFNGFFSRARPAQVISAAAAALRKTPAGDPLIRLASKRLAGPAGGPDSAERARLGIIAVAVARDEGGRTLAATQLAGPNPYDLTGDFMAWAAQELAEGRGRANGVIDVVDAFGLDESLAAVEKMGLVRTR